jgi:type 1 glutamine amidotransferase
MRRDSIAVIAALVLFAFAAPDARAQGQAQGADAPHVVFVTGDHEYRSEITMPLMAEILERHHGFRTTVLYGTTPEGVRDPKADRSIPGLEALRDADLAVFFLRWRTLPDEQMDEILSYINSGRPIIGLRTSTHAFINLTGEYAGWNDNLVRELFGQLWIAHHGNQSNTDVLPLVVAHPILRGVGTFTARSWLYHVAPLYGDDVTPIQIGRAVDSRRDLFNAQPPFQPVTWTKSYTGTSGRTARVFFTTLGHPEEFAQTEMRRLLVNGIYWALGMEEKIPVEGTNVELLAPYTPPPTH